MTSKKSYSSLILFSLKNNMWTMAISLMGLFFSMPIYAALNIAIIKNQFINGLYKEDVMPKIYARSVLGEGNGLLIFTVIVLAVIIATNGFSYLFSKERVDLYHSLPLKRTELFFINYITGFITFIIPYLLFMLSMIFIGFAYGLTNTNGICSAFICLFINALGFLCIYSITVLAIMLTGNIIVSLLATFVFMFYGLIARGTLAIYRSFFFTTYSSRTDNDLFTRVSSPIIGYINLIHEIDSYFGIYNLKLGSIAVFILFITLITVINLWLYKIRPSESATKSISFKKTMSVISIMLLIPASLYGAIGFESIATNNGKISYGWLLFGVLFVLFIGHFIIQSIFYRDFKSIFKNILNPIVAGCISILIISTFVFDLTGYDKYNPTTNNAFESAAISSYALQNYIEYYDFDKAQNEYGDTYYWVDTDEYRLNHMNITDKQLLNDFINIAIADSIKFDELTEIDDDSKYNNTAYHMFTVKYNFANNKEPVYREYYVDLKEHIDLYDRLYSNEDYKKGVFDIFEARDEDITDLKFANALGEVKTSLTSEQMITLMNTYKEELLSQGAYSLKDEIPVGYLYKDYSIMEHGSISRYSLYKSLIYPSFKKTLALLNEYGINVNNNLEVENISNIVVTNYNYEQTYAKDTVIEGSVSSDSKEYTSMEDIKAIYSVAISEELSNPDNALRDIADIDVQIKFEETPTSSNNYPITYRIPSDKIPNFVANDINYSDN